MKDTKIKLKPLKKRKKPVSATQKSLKLLRQENWVCEVVEKTIPKCFIKKDLFGFIDILAIKEGQVLGVQTTTGSNSADRVKKIQAHENYSIVKKAEIKIIVHGWRKLKEKCKNGNTKEVWKCKIIEL